MVPVLLRASTDVGAGDDPELRGEGLDRRMPGGGPPADELVVRSDVRRLRVARRRGDEQQAEFRLGR